MKIKNKIRIYFSTSVIALTALSSIIIYILFAEYREEEFQQRQKEKIQYTLGLLVEYKELSENLSAIMDELTIHDFYDEKMLIYNQHKQLVYRSVDDLPILQSEKILNELSPARQWIETKEDKYDVIGVYLEKDQGQFYALSKAYDAFGYTKLKFLKNTLIIIFIAITGIVLFISNYLARRISLPLARFAENISAFDINEKELKPLKINTTSYELIHLTDKFNELLSRMKDAFAFQKHATQHISHELKTPIAILVSELERATEITDPGQKDEVIRHQILRARSLADIITVLMEISKNRSENKIAYASVRLDELIFNSIEELSVLHPDFRFEVNFMPDVFPENHLSQYVNSILIQQAFLNVMNNCISYSKTPRAKIILDGRDPEILTVSFINHGEPVDPDEEAYLFDHFYIGNKETSQTGFGLGLVLTKEIMELHSGSIYYQNPEKDVIQFDLIFPLNKG